MLIRKRKIRRRLPTVNLRRLESMHKARIKLLIDPLKQVIEKELFPSIETFVSESKARNDDTSDIISSIFGKIRVSFAARHSKTLTEREIKRSADRIAQAGSEVHRAQLKTVLGVDPISAEPWLETEVNAFVKENASLITTLHTEQIDKIEQLIFREGRRRASVRDIHLKIRDVFKQSEARAALIARDQVSKFNGKLTELRQRNAGIVKYKWQTAQDGRVRTLSNSGGYSDHGRLNGQEFSWNKPPITVFKGKRAGERNHPGEDIQCFPGDSEISIIADVQGATRHMFAGELACITTSCDKLIEATFNHPILTLRGWVPIKNIKVGDYVVEIVAEDILIGAMDNKNTITNIRDMFASINKSGVSQTFSGRNANFHGDIPESNVNTVFTAGSLAFDNITKRIKSVDNVYLTKTNDPFSAISNFNQSLFSYFSVSSGYVRFFNASQSLFSCHLGCANNVCLRAVSYFNTIINKLLFNTFSGYTYSFANSKNTFPFKVALRNSFNIKRNIIMWYESFFRSDSKSSRSNFLTKNVCGNGKTFSSGGERDTRFYKFTRIDNVSTRKYRGHVYNLSTVKGWYSINNIVTHNCRCVALPVLDDLIPGLAPRVIGQNEI